MSLSPRFPHWRLTKHDQRTMSAAMFKQLLEEASGFLKDGKYQQALDAARRVSQFNASNFPALLCVGVASFHLQQWGDAETALRRAADLKPDLPAPWKNLVDLFDATGDAAKKIEVLEKLIGVFRSGNKVKPSQKWTAELATTAHALKRYGKAFDAWYSLVDESQGLSVDAEPNDELPSSLGIWLNLIELVQLPSFNLSDAAGSNVSMETLTDQFFAVAQRCDWTEASPEIESMRAKTDTAIALFFRHQLNRVKGAKAGNVKRTELKRLDGLTMSIIEWFPASRLAAEYLLLRSEDDDSPLGSEQVAKVSELLMEKFPKSPMSLMFQGFAVQASEPIKSRDLILEGLASCSASSFHECSQSVRSQMELATIALGFRDVEGCLIRLQKAQEAVIEKSKSLGCSAPKTSVFSEMKLQLLRARAHDLAGAFDAALEAYKNVSIIASSANNVEVMATASVGAAELLNSKNRAEEASELLEGVLASGELDGENLALVVSSKAWTQHLLGDTEGAKSLLADNHAKLTIATDRARTLKRLAIIYWNLGGSFRVDKQACFGCLLQAAKLTPSDGEVFAWLGKWYKDLGNDVLRAEKCFLKALALAPLNEMAGVALSEIYEEQGKTDLNVKLWQDLTAAPESAPTWALLRLAQHLVNQDDENAVSMLHLVLRNDPLNAVYWVSMGHVYRHFGKLVAAQRSYLRAIELGETGWCVLTELARIECNLHLFDDALVRIESAAQDTHDVPTEIVATVHAEVLFEQAKYFNGEGLYGRAAANVKKAASLLQTVAKQAPTLKLLGDIRSFAFYLSPLDFAEDGWIAFLTQGREAYEKVVELVSEDAALALAQAHYDVGVSCWYLARASFSIRGKRFNAFCTWDDSSTDAVNAIELLDDARKHLRQALELNPAFALAWNALGVVLKHPVAKQLAWIRAIQVSNIDAAWANLGMLYVHHPGKDGSRTADLARDAFLHLQAVNPNNPAMWIGYGMIYLGQKNKKDHRKAREAFQCALEMGYHLDALQGLVLSELVSDGDDMPRDDDEFPTNEVLLFAIKKYLERESFDPVAWSLLSTVQFRLGLLNQANISASKSVDLLNGSINAVLARNRALVACFSEELPTLKKRLEEVTQVLASSSTARAVVEIQKMYQLSNHLEALKVAQSALRESGTVPTDRRGAIASVTLILCALTVHAHRQQADEVAQHALAVVAERAACGQASANELESAEAYHRATGSLDAFVSTFGGFAEHNSDAGLGSSLSVHKSLALVDLAESSVFADIVRGTVVGDALELASLRSLLNADAALAQGEPSAPLKLVRAEPWNPAAYALAALRVYKTAVMNETAAESGSLRGALHLLESGLRVARTLPNASALSLVLLHWVFATVSHRADPSGMTAKDHAEEALQVLKESNAFSSIDKLLWEARVLVYIDQAQAIGKYADAIKAASGESTRVLTILYEVGGVCESLGLLDHAHHVWKTVMSWKSPEAAEFSIPAFLGNLHLAVVHGAKQNAKSAKKFSKTAATLAGGLDSSSPVATTARFVESVVAKM